MKKHIYYIIPIIGVSVWFTDLTYMEMNLVCLYSICGFFVLSLVGKAKIKKELIIVSIVVMTFAVIAQLIGLDRVWRLPEQHLIFGDYHLFPVEEFLYWHAGFSMPVLIYKHMEVYNYDMAIHKSIWFNRFAWRFVRIKNHTIEIRPEAVILFITTIIYSSYMFVIENYCIKQGFFEYIDESITFYVWRVPFEGLLMYVCVPAFIFTVRWGYGRRRNKI